MTKPLTPADEAALREIVLQEEVCAEHTTALMEDCPWCMGGLKAVERAHTLGRASGWQAGAEAQREADLRRIANMRAGHATWDAVNGSPLVTDDQRASVSGERDGIDPILQAASDESMKKALAYMDEQDAKLTDRNAGRGAALLAACDDIRTALRIGARDTDAWKAAFDGLAAVEAALKGGA